MADRDFSKSTIAVLLVLAILISFLSTWTLFDQIKKSQIEPTPSASAGNAQGEIKLKILSDKVLPDAASGANSEGEIRLVILPGEG